ncbi:SGNH/GDSL hydrolase family protein [Paenibacillus sp. KQZ6P-2]|uniref:SGNH/GDSL hydrolase family protein n=1 Tax=Paenibacillus mangrovi TaxID=2931978 RepID=A0A9X2B4Z0_9BACL|nr:SGNH/GDSL hydrolase family protein [Paenibacillus mangrovi]MCJ8014505.1 SGNH/GDSL hydrolase family protein [Paenibacillus mangrovi]
MISKDHAVILFQGDSVTDGYRDRGLHQQHYIGQSYVYPISSRLASDHAEKSPLFINRGISGNRVSDLYARWNEDAFSLNPDVISILIGVNDAWRTMSGEPSGVTDRFERVYRQLLEETKEVLPDTRLILCEPFVLKGSATEEKWEEWQKLMKTYQGIVRKLAEEFSAIFVPLQDAFDTAAQRAEPTYWLYDGVHPSVAGHNVIARRWLDVVLEHGLV